MQKFTFITNTTNGDKLCMCSAPNTVFSSMGEWGNVEVKLDEKWG